MIFRNNDQAQRLQYLKDKHNLDATDYALLKDNICNDFSYADQFVENAIGYFSLPLTIVYNIIVNDKNYTVPLAIEESSVVAALNYISSWIKKHSGLITSHKKSTLKIGQIQIPIIKDLHNIYQFIKTQQDYLINSCNENVSKTMFMRGGGVKKITFRHMLRPDQRLMGIIHIYVDACDAMGANFINQICEFLGILCAKALTEEEIGLCILSNLNDEDIVESKIIIPLFDSDLAKKISEASLFAKIDPYRAATNNKGIMNAIDAILIATCNDWRAVEAGLHAYAANSGSYRALSEFTYEDNVLVGKFTGPISVGIVGGVTRLHPTAKLMLKILNVNSACEFAELLGAVGLLQNLAALRALVSGGLVQGHMKLHIKNICMEIGACDEDKKEFEDQVKGWIEQNNYITHSTARNILYKIIAAKTDR